MPRYALLVLPATNRVYAEASVALTLAELGVCAETVLGGSLADLGETRLGGVPYVTFTAERLDDRAVAYLSTLSSMYALFELEGAESAESTDGAGAAAGIRLRPVTVRPPDRFDDDLLTIQKYSGKTNEYFTKLLLNVALFSSASASAMFDRRLHVFDPLCGRGTSLNQALMYGYDAAGIELDGKDVEAYAGFIRTWLKRKRLKHKADFTPVRRDHKVIGRRLEVSLAAEKEAYKAGDVQSLVVVSGDSTRARDFFRPRSFDVVVTDAPYGVQHGSRSEGAGLSRRPLDLLAAAVPGWVELLRPGGTLGISWNTFVAKRDELVAVLEAAGLGVCDSGPYHGFRHRVDQAIVRDLVVARRP
ncbi:MAG TPA: SAM-dependent methyltransferase [Actinopolymorphaceae bacterium]|nr:SAM-dependent methyltransferase [Actinopolymorphaceae bacterium]